MKRNRKTKENVRPQGTESQELDSALSAFGIDPPKRYRRTEQEPPSGSTVSRKREVMPKTRQQQHEEQNKKRKKNKLKRKIFACIALTLGIIAVIVILSLTVLFKIEHITIEGNERYTEDEIAAVLPIGEQDNLFLADTEKASAKLEENLPYIYEAVITRKLPSTLQVLITETPTVYAIQTEEAVYTLVDDTFKVLENGVTELPENAVTITNAAINTTVVGQTIVLGDEKMLVNLKEMTAIIRDDQLAEITSISSVDINNNYMVYDNRITFKLGSIDNLETKVFTALTAVEKLNESNAQVKGVMTVTGDKQTYFTAE